MEHITSAFIRRVELKSRKAWRGVVKYTDESGHSRQVTKTFPQNVKTKAQANAALVAWRKELEAEQATPDASLSVAEYARNYVAGLERGGTVEPSTLVGYMKSCSRIESEFSGVKLRDLTSKQVERWRDRMLDSGLSATTVVKHLRFLKQVCRHAVGYRDLVWSPCDAVKPPKRSQVEPHSLDAEMVARLLEKLDGSESTPLVTSAYIALLTGMREGEICALTWSDIDIEARTIRVEHAIGTGRGGTYLKTPKNESSRRIISMPSELVEPLVRRRDVQHSVWAQKRISAGVSATDEEFSNVFVVGSVDGSYTIPTIISRAWAGFAETNGIRDNKGDRAVFHTLRHTYASLLISKGYEATTVAKLLGHAKPSMTLDVYAAAFEARKQSAAKSVGEAIGEAITGSKPAEVIRLRKASNE